MRFIKRLTKHFQLPHFSFCNILRSTWKVGKSGTLRSFWNLGVLKGVQVKSNIKSNKQIKSKILSDIYKQKSINSFIFSIFRAFISTPYLLSLRTTSWFCNNFLLVFYVGAPSFNLLKIEHCRINFNKLNSNLNADDRMRDRTHYCVLLT